MGISWAERRRRWANRRAARKTRNAPSATGFVRPPEPRTLGFFARGKQLAAGNFALAGHRVETTAPWSIAPPSPGFAAELHGFGWLDHLAAAGNREARETAQGWLRDWIEAFGDGSGPGWEPDLAGRRMLRWIHHAVLLTTAQSDDDYDAFLQSLGHHTAFLVRRWQATTPGLPRFEALTGLLYSAVYLGKMDPHFDDAIKALAMSCTDDISAEGAIASRNPEELLEVFTHLIWVKQALDEAETPVLEPILNAIARIAPVLRALRHADGGLARFHSGGAGLEGRLEYALSEAQAPLDDKRTKPMGFARLEGGRTTVLIDADLPPGPPHSGTAHASMLAFELTSNRRQLVVNSGSGIAFGTEWERAARVTNAHSTLSIAGHSSARFGRPTSPDASGAPLTEGPSGVTLHRSDTRDGASLLLSHDGYVTTHGLTHIRTIELSRDGRTLLGEDTLAAHEPRHRRKFAQMLAESRVKGVPFTLRFHLHPEADPSLDMNGTAVSVALRSGEIWVFRFDGPGNLSLEPSVYLEQHRTAPQNSQQIVVRATIEGESCQINWTLAKAQDTPLAIRDIGRDDDLALPQDPRVFD